MSMPHICRCTTCQREMTEFFGGPGTFGGSLDQRIASLEAALQAAQKDAERLAWLDSQVSAYAARHDPYEHEGNIWSISGQFSSLSDAIDSGMQHCVTCGKPQPISCGMCSDSARLATNESGDQERKP